MRSCAYECDHLLMNDGLFAASRCQVSSCLCVLDDTLYVGTSWGCLVVCNATMMQVLSVMRIHGDEWPYSQTILPLAAEEEAGVVTIGRGYRDVIERYVKVYETSPSALSMCILSWNSKKWS